MLVVRRVTKTAGVGHGVADGDRRWQERRHDRLRRPGDEIGDIARTVAIFKNNALERQRLRDERAAHAVAAAEQRKTELRRFVDGFQASVGGIIDNG